MASPKGLQYCGCIADDALEQVGAGVEGWIQNASVVLAVTRDQVAIGRKRTLVMQLRWKESGEGSEPVVIKVGASADFQENVTSLEWLVFDDYTALAVGTSLGALLLYSPGGSLLFRQVDPASIFLNSSLFCL